MNPNDRRKQRNELRLIQREATWLQKALFALAKATDARERLQDDEDADASLVLELEEGKVPLDAVEEALEARVQKLLEGVRERRRILR